jgi:glutamyl-tRNA synthetase
MAAIAAMASAPHGAEEAPYPAALRPRDLDPDWFVSEEAALGRSDAALRFCVDAEPVPFVDRVQGAITERVDLAVGDFVLRRRDGLWAYQLAVVVDDLAMEIDEVVRGADLLASTARQIQLIRALGGEPPAYAHVPLLLDSGGGKLSKRDGSLTLGSLRAAGVRPEALTGYLAHSLGLLDRPEPCRPADLVAAFGWERIGRADRPLPADLTGLLLAR